MDKKQQLLLYRFLANENIICDLKAETRLEAISELCAHLIKNTPTLNIHETIEAVMAREKIMPTVIAPGLAVPHARMPNVKQLMIALGTSSNGIDFKTPDMVPVNLVILILTPKDDPALHLQILATLAKDFKNPDTIREIVALKTSSEILNFLSKTEGKMPDYLKAKDVMNSKPVTLFESDILNKAIDTFATQNVLDIPIIDNEKDLRGIISLEDILRLSLPEHLLWMDDLSPILNFQPFAQLLRNDKETKVADFMRENFISVKEDIPAIQLAKIFLMNDVRQICVTQGLKLLGVVNIKDFTTKIFWA